MHSGAAWHFPVQNLLCAEHPHLQEEMAKEVPRQQASVFPSHRLHTCLQSLRRLSPHQVDRPKYSCGPNSLQKAINFKSGFVPF